MTWVQLWVEAAAAAAESWAVISAVTEMSGCKFSGKRRAWMTAGFTLIQTAILLALYSTQELPFVSVILCVITTVFLSRFLTERSLLYRAFAAILVYLAVHAVDYVMLFSFGMIVEAPVINALTFYHILRFGPIRCLFLFVDKGAVLLIYLLLKRHISKLRETYTRHIIPLFALVSAAYGVMSVLLALVTSSPLITMQVAIVISWFFILLCVCIFLCFLFLSLKYQEKKAENELLSTCNSMMEKNYQRLHQSQRETARLVHDFNHHMGVLLELSQQQGADEIKDYIESLLDTHYKEQPMCKSGNDVINAIINCKVSEAREHHIRFQYNVNADVPPSLLPVDLCAILANQIDNAFDACKQIENQSRRAIDVHIWQTNETLFLFQVINTVERDPMAQNPNLRTTKTDRSRPHGFGIEGIRTAAEKYGGTLENRYQNGRFYSTVFLNLKS